VDLDPQDKARRIARIYRETVEARDRGEQLSPIRILHLITE
jgi:hypothetical protein